MGSLIREFAAAHGITVVEGPGVLRLQGPLVQEGEVVEPRQLYIHRLRARQRPGPGQHPPGPIRGSAPIGSSSRQTTQTLSQQLRAIEQASAQSHQGRPASGGQVTFGGER